MDFLRNIDIGTIAIQFSVLLFSLSIHKASHAWTASRFGDHTARNLGRVSLNPLPHMLMGMFRFLLIPVGFIIGLLRSF